MGLAEFLLLCIQMWHLCLLGISVLFLIKFYYTKRRNYYKTSLKYGVFSVPFAILIFFMMLHFGTLFQAVMYCIAIIIGLLPIILAIMGKD